MQGAPPGPPMGHAETERGAPRQGRARRGLLLVLHIDGDHDGPGDLSGLLRRRRGADRGDRLGLLHGLLLSLLGSRTLRALPARSGSARARGRLPGRACLPAQAERGARWCSALGESDGVSDDPLHTAALGAQGHRAVDRPRWNADTGRGPGPETGSRGTLPAPPAVWGGIERLTDQVLGQKVRQPAQRIRGGLQGSGDDRVGTRRAMRGLPYPEDGRSAGAGDRLGHGRLLGGRPQNRKHRCRYRGHESTHRFSDRDRFRIIAPKRRKEWARCGQLDGRRSEATSDPDGVR